MLKMSSKLTSLSHYRFLIAIVCCFFAIPGVSEKVGRIDSQHVDTRCAKRPITDETCRQKREKAINRNCVTQAEYELLKKYNLCPSCNWDEAGLDAYQGYCPSGCFSRGTRILVKDLTDGSTRFELIEVVAENTNKFEVWSVVGTKGSTPSLSSHAIRMAVKGPEELPLVHIQTQENIFLNVTSRHAVLLSSGEMVAAETIRVGDSLLKNDGTFLLVESIQKISTVEDVFNLLLDVEGPLSHTIITEGGFITGDQYWQGELEELLGSVVLSL